MPMGIVVISCVRPSVQPSMGLGLCIAYKALGRNGLQFGMLMYPDGLHSAFMDIVVGLSVRPSVRLFVYGIFRWLCICWQITWNKWHKIWHDDVVIIGRWLLPSLVDTGDICCHYWQHILVHFSFPLIIESLWKPPQMPNTQDLYQWWKCMLSCHKSLLSTHWGWMIQVLENVFVGLENSLLHICQQALVVNQ